MRKFRILLLLAAVMLEVGCGLPDSFFLQPPISTQQASPISSSFAFANPVHDINHDINVNFTGDELFYKFYSNQSQVELNAYSSSDPTDPAQQLVNKGFNPVCLGTDPAGSRTDPVIAVSSSLSASGSTVTVSINQSPAQEGSSYFVLATNPQVEIRRNVADTGNLLGFYKVFQENVNTTSNKSYLPGDADFSAIAAALPSGGQFYVAWYATSFGYTNTSTPSRSTAVYLGYMSINYQP
jgi:hypothetical protein